MVATVVEAPDGLCIRLPLSAFKGSGKAASEAQNERGVVVRGGSVSPWTIESAREAGDSLLLCGPAFHGSPIDTLLSEGPGAAGDIETLAAVAAALARLSEAGSLPSPLRSAGIMLSQEGDALFLPPRLAARALAAIGPAEGARTLVDLRSPHDRGAEAEASFFLAQLFYRCLSGRRAFAPAQPTRESPSASERFVPLSLLVPALDRALASLVDRALSGEALTRPDDWVAEIEAARGRGLFRSLTDDELLGFEKQLRAVEAAISRRLSFGSFARRRGGLMIGAAVVMAVIGIFAGSIVAGRSDRPDLSPLAPSALVDAYYGALDTLDQETLGECGASKAISADLNFAMNLSIIGKTRMAYEGKNVLVLASAWIAAGKPALAPGLLIHGITERRTAEAPASGPDEKRFEVSYSFFSPATDASMRAVETRRVDQLLLRKTKHGWKIAELLRLQGN